MSNLALVSYNKKFLYCALGAPGSTHVARMLLNSTTYQKIATGYRNSWQSDRFRRAWKNTLVTVGDTAFPKPAWLIKVFREDTSDRGEKYFNKKLCSACVVCENAYSMLKGRFRILYKKTECQLFKVKHIFTASVCYIIFASTSMTLVYLTGVYM